MSDMHIEVSHIIDATPQQIYAVISDYKQGHPAILPKPYFEDLIVEQGGQGEGTVALAKMNVMGVRRTFRMVITEPEPGRVLREVDEQAGVDTRFVIEPLEGGKKSKITIITDSKVSAGFAGLMERLMNPPITRRIYKQELQQLADYLRG